MIYYIGNFKEVCNLIAKKNPELNKKYLNPTNYSSHLIQDELLNLCVSNIRNKIMKEVEISGVCGIMCDEARLVIKRKFKLFKYT